MAISTYALGVDIGGSHISAALVDLVSGNIVSDSYDELKVDATASADTLLGLWSTFLSAQLDRFDHLDIVGIGIGVPGAFDYENGVALYDQNKFTQLYGIDMKAHFIKTLGFSHSDKITFLNDASAFALGEAWQGAAKGIDRVLMLTLGTGLGATFLQGGIVMTEGKGIPQNGTLYDEPFKEGMADEYFSTRYFINQYREQTGIILPNAKELAQRANKKDIVAIEIFNTFGDNLGEFLSPYIKGANTDMIIIGGNIGRAYGLFKKSVSKKLQSSSVEIRLASLAHLAPIVGAASRYR